MGILRTILVLSLTLLPVCAWASFYQGGFPARCTVYAACNDEGICIPIHLPLFEMKIVEAGENYLMMSKNEDLQIRTGYFDDIDNAKQFVSSGQEVSFHRIIIPNHEVSDAVGFDLLTVQRRGGTFVVADTFIKIVCSAIGAY
ncbi:hypothetical protein [Roseovarius sp. 2305UL8-3]|uniref:hypothetical protein n=1 Tax=Roseovarius conchicola TaxID=3121636 RepID=UPI0035279DBE